MNSRWVAFARANGRSPEAQLDHDWGPVGARGAPFMAWISTSLREWGVEVGHARGHDRLAPLTQDDHRLFDAWLADVRRRR